jgi:hypothetical protein
MLVDNKELAGSGNKKRTSLWDVLFKNIFGT